MIATPFGEKKGRRVYGMSSEFPQFLVKWSWSMLIGE
jgi:hypothetical protein